jgi:hypothetical protein
MKKLLVIGFCLLGLAVSGPASATTFTLTPVNGTGTDLLGEVFVPGDLSGGQAVRDAAAVNGLLGLACTNCYSGTTSPSYYRSPNSFGSLPAATDTGNQLATGGGITQSGNSAFITLTQTFTYLVASYDGPNGGAWVWDISNVGVGDTIEIPRYAFPSGTVNVNEHLVANTVNTQFGITNWTMLNPTSVPDGGSTMALLGSAFLGIGLLRRRFGKG